MQIPQWLLSRMVRRWPIYRQVRAYKDWRAVRYPFAAEDHERELLRFVFHTRIRDVNEILLEDISDYRDSHASNHYRNKTFKVMRSFLQFCKSMGYANIQIECEDDIIRMEKIHHLLDVDNVIRVKKLRQRMVDGKPMSYRKIASYMSKADKRTYDVHAIYRWANYPLPPGLA